MKHLDLFSGIGGAALAAQRVWQEDYEPVAFVEIDDFCRKVLMKNWEDCWNDVLCFSDIRKTDFRPFRNIDLLTAGVPCQPTSSLGKSRADKDERWLWPETLDVIWQCLPRWCLLENPPRIRTLNGGKEFAYIISSLASFGYGVWWDVIPSAAIGAKHIRKRLWILAYTYCEQRRTEWDFSAGKKGKARHKFERETWRNPTPRICRRIDGIPNLVDRLKSLGNAWQPQVAQVFMEAIKEIEEK